MRKLREQEKEQKESPKHVFLALHNVLFRDAQFFSYVDWDLLVDEFNPTVFVTLIDDSFDVLRRIHEEEAKNPTGSIFQLREIFAWRSSEIKATDQIARNLYVKPGLLTGPWRELLTNPDSEVWKKYRQELPPPPRYIFRDPVQSFVVAVKHPPQMLYRLLFKRGIFRIYTCFPISDTREHQEAIEEVNEFVAKLSEKFTVFNPVTIDEMILEKSLQKTEPESKDVSVDYGLRWPLKNLTPMVYDENVNPRSLQRWEIEDLVTR